jgi:hypothetical protein
MKLQSTIGGDRLQDPRLCVNCGSFRRLPSYRYCHRCLEYLKPIVRAWARRQNPVPGEDIPEC